MLSTMKDYLPSINHPVVQRVIGEHVGSISAIAGAASAVPLTQAAISTLGFATTGITSGSVAAGMMSTAAITNGGGVAAGSTVALLQSIGALGVTSLGALPVLGICAVGACTATGCYLAGKTVLQAIPLLQSKL